MEMMENREGGGKGELLESQSMDLSLLFLGRRLLALARNISKEDT